MSVVTGSPAPSWLQWRPGARREAGWDCATMDGGLAEQCLCYEKKTAVCEMNSRASQLLRLTGLCRDHGPPLQIFQMYHSYCLNLS